MVVGDLSVRGVVKNHDPARAIGDASWSEFRTVLEYQAGWYGRTVVVVDRWFPSSELCSACGVQVESLPLRVREWTCPCGAVHGRDVNAAGLAERRNACGGLAGPEPRQRRRHSPVKQETRTARSGLPALHSGG